MIICKRPAPPDHHLQPRKEENEKCIFETVHNEIECVLSIKESNCKKNDQNFHICLRSGPTGLTPPPPPPFYGQPDHKISVLVVFDASLKVLSGIKL